jgi:Protein of unknown function (DUF3102)
MFEQPPDTRLEQEGYTMTNPRYEQDCSRIRTWQREIRESGGNNVLHKTNIGGVLADLKRKRRDKGKAWEAWVENEFGYSKREASRLMLIYENWGTRIGSDGADSLLSRFPDETQKLEWICRVPWEELERFEGEVDCHALDRNAVKKNVLAVIGGSELKDIMKNVFRRMCSILAVMPPPSRDEFYTWLADEFGKLPAGTFSPVEDGSDEGQAGSDNDPTEEAVSDSDAGAGASGVAGEGEPADTYEEEVAEEDDDDQENDDDSEESQGISRR